jgi:hypothetical protein
VSRRILRSYPQAQLRGQQLPVTVHTRWVSVGSGRSDTEVEVFAGIARSSRGEVYGDCEKRGARSRLVPQQSSHSTRALEHDLIVLRQDA